MTTAARPSSQPAGGVAHPPPSRRALAAVVARGVRDRRRAPLTWGGSLGALSALVVAIWPSIEEPIADAVESYPDALKEAFGIGELTTVEAYLDAEMFSLILPLTVSVFAVRAIVGAIPSAEERGHLDTLLSTPLTRRVLVAGAFAASALTCAAILAVVGVLTLLASAVAGSELEPGAVAGGLAAVWALAMLFAGIAVLATGWIHRGAIVTAIAAGVLVAMYMVDVVGRVADGLDTVRLASAFRYYGSPLSDGFDPAAFAGMAVLGAALAAVGALVFERRDVL